MKVYHCCVCLVVLPSRRAPQKALKPWIGFPWPGHRSTASGLLSAVPTPCWRSPGRANARQLTVPTKSNINNASNNNNNNMNSKRTNLANNNIKRKQP